MTEGNQRKERFMAKHHRMGIAALGFAIVLGSAGDLADVVSAPARPLRPGREDEELPLPAVDKDMAVNVVNIAGLLKKGNTAGAKRLAQGAVVQMAKQGDDLSDLMHLHKARNKGGLGLGSKPRPNPATDGLEKMVQALARQGAIDVKDMPAYEEGAFWIAAIAEITALSAPPKAGPAWIVNANAVRANALGLAKASAAKDANDMRKAGEKIANACLACHGKFK